MSIYTLDIANVDSKNTLTLPSNKSFKIEGTSSVKDETVLELRIGNVVRKSAIINGMFNFVFEEENEIKSNKAVLSIIGATGNMVVTRKSFRLQFETMNEELLASNVSSLNQSSVPSGASLLQSAATGDIAGIDAALAARINVNFQDSQFGNTALHEAVSNNQLNAMKRLLLVRGINVNLKNNDGYTPLHLAIMEDYEENSESIMELLKIRGVNVNNVDLDGNTPLMDLLSQMRGYSEDLSMLDRLISLRANVNAKNSYGDTVISYTYETDNLEVMKKVLAAKANPNTLDSNYNTVLHYLIPEVASIHENQIDDEEDKILMFQEFLKYGANLNIKNRFWDFDYDTEQDVLRTGKSACSLAFLTPEGEIVDFYDTPFILELIQKGAIFDDFLDEEYTPLHIAVENEDIELVNALLSTKIDINAQYRDEYYTGPTPLMSALGESEAKQSIIDILLSKKANIKAKDDSGRTALMIAVSNVYFESVKKLIAAKADVNSVDANGDSVLHNAIETYNSFNALQIGSIDMFDNIIPELLKQKIKINATNKSKLTPLHFAILGYASHPNKGLELINELMKLKPNLKMLTSTKKTYVQFAQAQSKPGLDMTPVINRLNGIITT